MRLLVLGGTVFLGRHFVEQALARGHELTLFHRGRSNPGLFPEVETITGDRDGGLEPLRAGRWDAALDFCGYVPRVVGASADLLRDRVDHYTFVSTMSVYADEETVGQDEDAPLATLADPAVEEITGETYGALKALCEEAALERFADRGLVVRPGLIVGPWDPTDRFTWWPWRFSRGGEVLVPGPTEWGVECTDVRDLASFLLGAVERGLAGTFNASGPAAPERPTALDFFEACCGLGDEPARPVWADERWLLDEGVQPWMELPLWVTSRMPAHATRSAARAVEAGLAFRPIEETLRDTLGWALRDRGGRPWGAGLAPERESELLARWHARGRG